MRRSLSLIELIFSMVIIGIAFSVLPKILQVSAKSAQKSLKEEAFYNAVALMGLIKSLPWDEKNNDFDDILLTDGAGEYRCAKRWGGYYRQGGFVGSRSCAHRIGATSIGDDGDSIPDDIDDFDAKVIEAASKSKKRLYELMVSVKFVKDFSATAKNATLLKQPVATKSNSKMVTVEVVPKGVGSRDRFGKIYYHAFNIGQLALNKLAWAQ